MKTFVTISKDFFRIALVTWLLLVFFEFVNPGMSHRFINLEIYLYFLIIVYIFNKIIDR